MQCAMTFVKLCTFLYKNQAVHKWIYFTYNFLNEFYNKFTFISLALLFSAVFCITVFFLLLTLFVKPDKFPRLWHKIATTMLHQWRLRKPLYDDYSSSSRQQHHTPTDIIISSGKVEEKDTDDNLTILLDHAMWFKIVWSEKYT